MPVMSGNLEFQTFSKFPQTSICRLQRYQGIAEALNLETQNFRKYFFGENAGFQ